MKTFTYQCDRCGNDFEPKYIERGYYGRFVLLHYQKSNEEVVCGNINHKIDLCPICNKEFNKWFEAGKYKENKINE